MKRRAGAAAGPAGPRRSAAPRPPRPTIPRPVISPANKRRLIAAAVIAAILLVLLVSAQFWMQWWWFGSMGFRRVLVRRLLYEGSAFGVVALVTFGIVAGNAAHALRITKRVGERSSVVRFAHRTAFYLTLLISVGAGVLLGLRASSRWETLALWVYGRAFGIQDPVFNRDVGFYIFALPSITFLWELVTVALLLAIGLSVALYVLRLGLSARSMLTSDSRPTRHLVLMLAALAVLMGLRLILANYHLVYSTRGPVYGASYTDLNAIRPANWVGAIALFLVAAALAARGRFPRRREAAAAIGALAVLAILMRTLLPVVVQETIVGPDELGKERASIANNIEMTQSAYALTDVAEAQLTGEGATTEVDIEANPLLVDNVRLWDYRVARETFQQLQSFAPYYAFLDVDVDRYDINGQTQQVLISAREMNQDGLPTTSSNWTNRRLVYTHGYGVVVSPVDEVTRNGLPAFLVQRVPPSGEGTLAITRPEIYFGEANLDWVVTNTKVSEFTALPEVSQEISVTSDDMVGGIRLDDQFTRLLSGLNLADRNLMLSGNITDESTLLLHRNIIDRSREIAPFLQYDSDPYLVIAEGRLVWVIDAYTQSDRYPYATPENGINYLRASVKVTIDAATGQTIFYRTAEADPVADAYSRMFGSLFEPITSAPPSVSEHFRYPERLYDVQSEIYASVHVADPADYYNGEDRWAIPQSQASSSSVDPGDERGRMEPYYVTIPLPGEAQSSFTLIRPFVPGGATQRQNMTAWMAGRSDSLGNLSLSVYTFPRQTQVFGPAQVEARITQEPVISRDLSLWSQAGTEVIFGNLLVIPINQTVFYIQPLYLRSTANTAIPELRRVIVATGDEVVMGETLAGALTLLGDSPGPQTGDASTGDVPSEVAGSLEEIAARADAAYQRGQDALARGDWAAYGAAQEELRQALNDLNQLAGDQANETPAATPVAQP